jgi:hypothetical protein
MLLLIIASQVYKLLRRACRQPSALVTPKMLSYVQANVPRSQTELTLARLANYTHSSHRTLGSVIAADDCIL